MNILETKKYFKFNKKIEPYLYILPYFLIFLSFIIVPAIIGLITSFFDWQIVGYREFIGFGNYKELFADKLFLKAVRNTAIYSLIYVTFTICIGLVFATLLNEKYKMRNFFRTTIFLPYVFMIPAIGVMWRWLMDSNYGLLNYYLGLLGLPHIGWLTRPNLTLISIAIVTLWESAGYSVVLYLAGLQMIPAELYEAARIDGASKWQVFRKITFPLLQPTTFFLLVITSIGAFKTFGQPFVMTGGGPVDSSMTIVMYIFNTGFKFGRLGYSSTISTVLFIGILSLSLLQFKFIKQRFD